MFELRMMQKDEVLTFYFDNIGEMFAFIHSAIKNSKNRTEYAIRVVEDGENYEEEN